MDVLDEALERLHATSPEYHRHLSNHGPMVVEALAHHGFADRIHPWLDDYLPKLEPRPHGRLRIGDWRAALGDPSRLGDWLDLFDDEIGRRAWGDVLATWWPRLLPGIAAAAGHGAIRTGHAVRALTAGDTPTRRRELGVALASWAARYRPIPFAPPGGTREADDALAGVPLVADQRDGSAYRLGQLGTTAGWLASLRSMRVAATGDARRRRIDDVTTAAARRFATHGHGDGVMLVHAVTAPTAVARVLPHLPRDHWGATSDLAWALTAAFHAAYAPAAGVVIEPTPLSPDELLRRAVDHGDEHVIKLADAVIDAHARTGDPLVLTAGARGLDLVPAPSGVAA